MTHELEAKQALDDLRCADAQLREHGEKFVGTKFSSVLTAIRDAVSVFERLPAAKSEPVAVKANAWMRRWAFDGVDVMSLPKSDRPRGWQLHEVSQNKLLKDDVPLYALASEPANG